ncbi:MAG: hypothetical protein R3202_14275, partial [Candidatus Competibacterales bacterium]|nr:hypothetical protein [Candidatus Competibacterales bacterium]
MRIKHYFLILLTLVVIAFFQPFVVFLGNLIVILAVGAYIYSDLTPEAQDAYEQKLGRGLAQVRHTLRRHKTPLQHIPTRQSGGRLRRLLGRSPRQQPATTPVRHGDD